MYPCVCILYFVRIIYIPVVNVFIQLYMCMLLLACIIFLEKHEISLHIHDNTAMLYIQLTSHCIIID